MSHETLRAIVSRLSASATALTAVAAALDARVSGVELDARLRPRVDDVLDALGARDALEGTSAAELRPLLAEIRALVLTHEKLLHASSRGAGWTHSEPSLLRAAGEVTAGFPRALRSTIAPALAGLAARLAAPGAAFLDVGAGVGILSVEMARQWPWLRVVGIDPWAPSLAIARENVRAAGLEVQARIELREQAGEDLSDRDAFDLAWVPSAFIPGRAVPAIVERVHRALRPGGWLIFPILREGSEPLGAALARLTTTLFGGAVTKPPDVEAFLVDKGFTEVRTLPAPPFALGVSCVGRRSL